MFKLKKKCLNVGKIHIPVETKLNFKTLITQEIYFQLPAIEREDFPAPQFPYAVEELKRRLSTSSVENEISDDEYSESDKVDEDKLRKTVETLEKYNDSSIAHVIRQNIEDSHKKQRYYILLHILSYNY